MIPTSPIPRFEVHRFLGRGALGDVYLAWDHKRLEEVALKVVRTTAVPSDMLEAEKNGAVLHRELATTSPQVPKIFDSGEENEIFWISMEYVDGDDLAVAIRQGSFPEERAARITIQLCDFLEKLHGLETEIGGHSIRGVIHGDLKPENLRLQRDDRLRILDFGVAKQLSLSRSFTYQPFGSLPYLPPERLEKGQVDRLSDLWAVGVILYLMITAHLPFAGKSPLEVEQQILKGVRRPLPDSCSYPLRWILDRSLAHAWDHRYSSAAALKADLTAFLDDTFAVPAAPETRRTVAPRIAPSNPAPAAASPVSGPHRRARGGRWLPVALGLLLPLGMCQAYVGFEGRSLQRDLLTATTENLPYLWKRYQSVQKLDVFRLVPGDVPKEMRVTLLRAVDSLLSHDFDPGPPSSKTEWQAALGHLEAALEIDSADARTRAKLAYCRSRLALIEAESFAAAGDHDRATRRRQDALSELEEAARIDGAWPEPHVQRARIFAQMESFDLARVETELEAAGKRGYPEDRLVAYRADSHLAEAQRLYAEALRVRGTPRERDLLANAIEHFTRAIDLYDRTTGDPRTEHNRAIAVRHREMLENRYSDLPLPLGEDVAQSVLDGP